MLSYSSLNHLGLCFMVNLINVEDSCRSIYNALLLLVFGGFVWLVFKLYDIFLNKISRSLSANECFMSREGLNTLDQLE